MRCRHKPPREWGKDGLVEIVVVSGFYQMFAAINQGFDIASLKSADAARSKPERVTLRERAAFNVSFAAEFQIHAYNETDWSVTGPLMLSKSTVANCSIDRKQIDRREYRALRGADLVFRRRRTVHLDISAAGRAAIWRSLGKDATDTQVRGRFAGRRNGARSHARAAVQPAPSQEGPGHQALIPTRW